MPDVKSFNLPDVGEGLLEADILDWRVAVGDTVEVNQIIVEVETAKAAVELPSPFAGVVTELLCAAGDTVDVGATIIRIDTDPNGAPAAVPPVSETAGSDAALHDAGAAAAAAPKRQPVLVGYGPAAEGAVGRRRRRAVVGSAAGSTPSAQAVFSVSPSASSVQGDPDPDADPVPDPLARAATRSDAPEPGATGPNGSQKVLAKPPVRKLAKELGVDLSTIAPSGPGGVITRADIASAANSAAPPAGSGGAWMPSADARRETRLPIKGVRKHTAAAMVGSAFTAPHVTEFLTCDVSAMMELRDRVAARREFAGVRVSPLLFVAKAVILAAKRTPEINASWDEQAGEIVLRHYVNLGIAAATERGLIVPNIKDADRLSLRELAEAIGSLTDIARSGKTTPAAMAGGSITITNVGVFGVDTGTPILNPGEAGIVCVGAIRRMPWVVGSGTDEQVAPRWVTTLGVSFDHRLVDGQQGSQFLADVAAVLTDPGLALL